MVSVTVPTCDFFWPVKMSSSSILALAEPCLPGLDLDMLRILYASSSIATYLPIFSVLISALVVPGMSPLVIWGTYQHWVVAPGRVPGGPRPGVTLS